MREEEEKSKWREEAMKYTDHESGGGDSCRQRVQCERVQGWKRGERREQGQHSVELECSSVSEVGC